MENHDQPFLQNPTFRSEHVLSEASRDKIWNLVMEQGMPIKAVSATYGVDMRRIAAVLRMKQIERRWASEVGYPFLFLVAARASIFPSSLLSPLFNGYRWGFSST
jgi:hypothetical protein